MRERVKAAHTWMKENGAPEEYVVAVQDILDDFEATEKLLCTAEDNVKMQEDMISTREARLEEVMRTVQDASDDLEEAVLKVRTLVP